jgi:hypothetical protein
MIERVVGQLLLVGHWELLPIFYETKPRSGLFSTRHSVFGFCSG